MTVPELKTAPELAHALGRNTKWIYRMHEERGLPAFKIGRALLFDLAAVVAWLERQRVGEWPTTNNRSSKPFPPEVGEASRPDAPPHRHLTQQAPTA